MEKREPLVEKVIDKQSLKSGENFWRPQLRRLKEEVHSLNSQSSEKDKIIEGLKKELKEVEVRKAELKRENLQCLQKIDKLEKSLKENSSKVGQTAEELNASSSLIENLKERNKKLTSTKMFLEKEVSKNSSLFEKVNDELQELKKNFSDLQEIHQSKVKETHVEMQNKNKEIKELCIAVRKQMQLIHNLKRQIIHIKVGIAKEFTEKEVMKAIDKW
ncbi:testis-expressed protein 9-like [Parasteatoda tepidariorum]|uniref:testis-expressed protein 9-like n=1 Tax=Parasteatoda tepidariorum TaxID=114398 RepID=UPI0039BCAEE6